jgi:hypothetical protein
MGVTCDLGGAVQRLVRRGDQAADGTGIDDAPTALAAHDRQHGDEGGLKETKNPVDPGPYRSQPPSSLGRPSDLPQSWKMPLAKTRATASGFIRRSSVRA